jgi:hypothetical protein
MSGAAENGLTPEVRVTKRTTGGKRTPMGNDTQVEEVDDEDRGC